MQLASRGEDGQLAEESPPPGQEVFLAVTVTGAQISLESNLLPSRLTCRTSYHFAAQDQSGPDFAPLLWEARIVSNTSRTRDSKSQAVEMEGRMIVSPCQLLELRNLPIQRLAGREVAGTSSRQRILSSLIARC